MKLSKDLGLKGYWQVGFGYQNSDSDSDSNSNILEPLNNLNFKEDPEILPNYIKFKLPPNEDIITIYDKYWHAIQNYKHENNKILDYYNFRVKSSGFLKTFKNENKLWYIYNKQKYMFKLNIAFGYILRDTNTGIYEYWHNHQIAILFLIKLFLFVMRGILENF